MSKNKQNKFKKAIADARLDKQRRCQEMEELSDWINDIIGLTQEELDDAGDENISFNVPGYSISVRSFPWNDWRGILVVVPSQVSCDKVGYANCDEEKFFPISWEINENGTDSTWYPSDDEIPKILQAIKTSFEES